MFGDGPVGRDMHRHLFASLHLSLELILLWVGALNYFGLGRPAAERFLSGISGSLRHFTHRDALFLGLVIVLAKRRDQHAAHQTKCERRDDARNLPRIHSQTPSLATRCGTD